jgi:hypothetical protein
MRKIFENEQCLEYEGIASDERVYEIGRMGHLAFIEEFTGNLVLFGG